MMNICQYYQPHPPCMIFTQYGENFNSNMIQMTDAIVVNAMGEYMLVNGMLIVNKLFQCELCEDVWKIINYDKRVVLK